LIVQVPVLANATRPEVELTVQTDVVEELYVLDPAPPPTTVELSVGGVSSCEYEALYELASMLIVLDTALTVKVAANDVAVA
jgi:hypothetical protein